MQRTVAAVRETCVKENINQPKIVAVTVLTSANKTVLRETGIKDSEPLAQVLRLAKLTQKSGLHGVVASPREISAIRQKCGADFLIVTPGIRAKSQAIEIDDQKRTLTAGEAVRNKADFIVVGRPILQASNRLQAAREILTEVGF